MPGARVSLLGLLGVLGLMGMIGITPGCGVGADRGVDVDDVRVRGSADGVTITASGEACRPVTASASVDASARVVRLTIDGEGPAKGNDCGAYIDGGNEESTYESATVAVPLGRSGTWTIESGGRRVVQFRHREGPVLTSAPYPDFETQEAFDGQERSTVAIDEGLLAASPYWGLAGEDHSCAGDRGWEIGRADYVFACRVLNPTIQTPVDTAPIPAAVLAAVGCDAVAPNRHPPASLGGRDPVFEGSCRIELDGTTQTLNIRGSFEERDGLDLSFCTPGCTDDEVERVRSIGEYIPQWYWREVHIWVERS